MFGWFKKRAPVPSATDNLNSVLPVAAQVDLASHSAIETIREQLPREPDAKRLAAAREFIFGYAVGRTSSTLELNGHEMSAERISRVLPSVARQFEQLLPEIGSASGSRLTQLELAGAILGSTEPNKDGKYLGIKTAFALIDPWVRSPRVAMLEYCYEHLNISRDAAEEVSDAVERMSMSAFPR